MQGLTKEGAGVDKGGLGGLTMEGACRPRGVDKGGRMQA